MSEAAREKTVVGSRFPVLIEICDQAFSIGTSIVLLAADHREKRAVRDFHAELLGEKVFRANLQRSERNRKRQENGRRVSRRRRNLLTGKAAAVGKEGLPFRPES
ncbi:MAG: hypothetical protein ABJC28_03390 [Acidobacteriota bacterium]